MAKAYLEYLEEGGRKKKGKKKNEKNKTQKTEGEKEKLDQTLSAFTEFMSPGMTDLEYLMLKLLTKSLIPGLAQDPAHTGVGICSSAAGELILMDAFNKIYLLNLNAEFQFLE